MSGYRGDEYTERLAARQLAHDEAEERLGPVLTLDEAGVERLAAALRAQKWNWQPVGVRKSTFRGQARAIIARLRDD